MALKRMAVQRIDANAVSFPRMMLLSRVQPEFKDCAQADGAGPSLSRGGESLPLPGWVLSRRALPPPGLCT